MSKGKSELMKTGKLRSLEAYRPYLLIAAVTVAAHGLILLNQGVYWDSWLHYTSVSEHRWDILYNDFYLLAGRPTKALILWSLGFFPSPLIAQRWLTLGLLIGRGCLIYAVGIKTKWLTSFESLTLAILTIAYPAFKVSFEFIFFSHALCYFLFALGALLSFMMVDQPAGQKRALFRILSLLAFALSFTVESFLVLYYWFLILLFIKMAGGSQPVSHYIKRLVRLADYALVPIVYWIVDQYVFPASGAYTELASIQLNLPRMEGAFLRFFQYGIWQPLSDFNLLLWLFALTLLSIKRVPWECELGKGRRDYLVLLAGIVGLLFAMLPYALVGKSPGPEGWETRHALLIGLPVALTLIGLLRLALSGYQHSGVVALSVVAVLAVAFCTNFTRNYIEWQARWVKDSAIIASLRELDEEEVAKVSVYLIDDHTRLAGGEPYRSYEWAGLFREAWGTETHIGLTPKYRVEEFLNDNPDADRIFSEAFLMSDVDPSGCRATLTILYAEQIGDLKLTLRYFYFKFLKPAHLNEFLLHTILMNQHSLECN
jgi:hypothetical protein